MEIISYSCESKNNFRNKEMLSQSKTNLKNIEMCSLSKNNFKNKNIDIEKSKKNVNVKYIKNPKIFISLCFILFFNKIKRIKIYLYLIYI